MNLSALVDYCQPGLIPDHASLDPERRLENVRRAMELAEQHLQVPQLMQPEDLVVDKPDKLSTMTYLSQFCCPSSVGERTLLEFLRRKLPKHNITNFTTDWVDGRLLGALTASLCVYEPHSSQTNPTERCRDALRAAETHLFARKILETSEFINPELDTRLRMAQLVELQRASQPPRLLDTHTPEVTGAGQEILVEVEVPEKGALKASAQGEISGEARVKIEQAEVGRCVVKIVVPTRDRYTVTITHSGQVIRGCPFVVTLNAYSIPHTETKSPKKVGDPCEVIFDTSQLGGKSMEVKVVGKESGEVSHVIQESTPGASKLSFIPLHCDTYTVTLLVDGKPVRESPYTVPLLHMVDPGRVVLGDILSSGVNSPVSLAIDCRNAGSGVVTANCTGQHSGDVPVNIVTSGDTPTGVTFTPASADLFLLHVLYEGGEVPGSPWCVDLRNLPPIPGKVSVVNTPTGVLQVGKLLTVEFDAVNAGSGQLTASCRGAVCGEVPVSIVTMGLGKFQVGFVPTVPDNYFISVFWAGTQVHGSPFQISFGCEPVNPMKCRLVGLVGNPALVKVRGGYQGLLGRQMVLEVNTAGAGGAKLEVRVRSPTKEVLLTPQPTPSDPKTYSIRYTPLYQGQYSMHILWGGTSIPGSPVKFSTVTPLVFPLAEPISVQLDLDGKKKDLNGEAVLQKEGLPEKVMATVEKATNKNVVLALDPTVMEPGTYVLHAFSKFKELPNSPVVLVYGAEERDSEKDSEAVTETDGSSASPGETTPAKTDLEKVSEVAVVADGLSETSEELTRILTPLESDVPATARDRSYTTDLSHSRGLIPDTHHRSHSVGKRPEIAKTTTPIDTEATFHLPQQHTDSHEHSPVESNNTQQGFVAESSPPVADSAPPEAALPLEAAHLTSTPEVQREIVEDLGRKTKEPMAIVVTEEHSESEKDRKKTSKEEDKATAKKEKAEKARREKEEKKKKNQKKKEGGLNLEDQQFRVGIKMKYKLHCEALGSKSPAIICSPPDAAKHAIVPAPQFGKNTYWCELTPTQVGKMEVSIVYEDFHILGSPFLISVDARGNASHCTMVETSSTCKQDLKHSLLFCINVPESAGKGKLTASVKSGTTSRRVTGVRTSAATDNHYHIEFVPSEGLEYLLSVKFDERHIKGSPFVINLGDPTKCKVHGEGLKQAQIEEDNTFEVDGTEAGPGELLVKIESEGKPVEHRTTVTGDKQYRISYSTRKPGLYKVSVLWGEGHVKNSPFTVPCISATQFRIAEDTFHRVYAGALTSFEVITNARHIRQKQLSIFAHPKNDITKMFSGEISRTKEGVFNCSLRPSETHMGLCNLHICWNGKEINGSPYELNVEAPPNPADFTLEAVETESGDIAVDVTGPTDVFAADNVVATSDNIFTAERIATRVTKVSNERSRIQLLPTAGGEYQLSILYAGNHIASSPFVLTQADPTQCKIAGEGIRVSRINELTKFTVDHSKAGLGHLKVDIEGEGGRTVELFIASGEALSEVSYISRELGAYKIFAYWGEHQFPESPFTMYTVDPAKFGVRGPLPRKLSVGQPLRFSVKSEVPVAEWERLSVTAKLIHQQKIYRGAVETRKKGFYQCSLDIPEQGHYAVYVQCRGLDVQGSPFKLKMMPQSRADQVKVTGEGLKGGAVGERQRFTIDTRDAGFGNVGLKVQGPRGGLSIDMHRHDNSERVIVAEYTPEYPGKYTIHVSWAGLAVPGSPISVVVRKREGKRDRDRVSKLRK